MQTTANEKDSAMAYNKTSPLRAQRLCGEYAYENQNGISQSRIADNLMPVCHPNSWKTRNRLV
jgi:hypothetical protein